MVKIEDAFEERKKQAENGNLIAKLAKEVFGDTRVDYGPYDKGVSISMYNDNGKDSSWAVSIDAVLRHIRVYREQDYDSSLRLAEKCEMQLGAEFRLSTYYERKPVNP